MGHTIESLIIHGHSAMQDVFAIEPSTTIQQDASYVISYPHLIEFFAQKQQISPSDVVCGAHMVYGWMPTILDLYPDQEKINLEEAARLLTTVKRAGSIQPIELEGLSGLVNNSLVGVSKLLHFVAPERFAIWDSKVYSFVYEERPHNYRVNNADKYLAYLRLLDSLVQDSRFPSFHAEVQRKLGYEVTPFRALELVMFLRAPVY